jgi:uncharacterized protein (DUF1778 family)
MTISHSALKSDRLEARISANQKQLFQQAAYLLGRPLTDFVVSTLQDAAMQVIQEHELLKLLEQDRQLFAKSLMKPPSPSNRLIKAVRRYRKEVISK